MINAHTGDIPPPQFINSVNELRGFSAALSAFLRRYDELHDHISFINSAIDSKLPNHVLCSVNPNQSAVTSIVESSCGHTVNARKPESPNFLKKAEETVTLMKSVEIEALRMPRETDISKKAEETDISKKPEEIDVSKKALETNFSRKPDETDTSKKLLETDLSKKPEEIDVLNKPVEINVLKEHEEIDESEKLEEIDIQINSEEIDESTNPNQSAVSSFIETSCGHNITDVLEDIVSEPNPKATATTTCEWRHANARKPESPNFTKKIEESDTLMKSVETDTLKKPEEIGGLSKKALETDFSRKPEETDTSKKLPETDFSRKPEETDFSNKPEEINVLKKLEEIEVSKKLEEIDVCKNPEEINVLKKLEEIEVSKKLEEIDVCKNPEEIYVCQKPGETEILKKPEYIVESKKAEKTNALKISEESDAPKKLLIIDLPKKPVEIHQSKKLEKIDISNKHTSLSNLQNICKTMCARALKRYIQTHFPHPNEIAEALKLAIDPAKLVLKSIRKFFLQGRKSYTKSSSKNKNIVLRQAAVLILESFVMMSSDGIKISKEDLDNAAQAASDWRTRAIKEGGLRYMSEDDAKGLLFLICGFGIPDRVFMIEDIRDLIRVCNRTEICSALRRSSVLMPRIPEVVDSMVKNNLEIEAADIAYTFGLEDKCHLETILTNFLHNKIEEFRNGSCLQTNVAVRRHLSDLKSIRKCLEDHKVDPSKLFLDFKINEVIQYLMEVIDGLDSKSKGEKSTLKRKAKELEFSETANHQQAKKICYSYEDNMPNEHSTVDKSTYFDCNPVACGLASGGCGGLVAGPMVHTANQWPNGSDDQLLEIDASKKLLETDFSKNPEEIDVLKKHEEIEVSKKLEEIEVLKKPEEIYVSKKPVEIKVLKNPEKIDESKKALQTDVSRNPKETDTSKKLLETDFSKKPEEIDESKTAKKTNILKNSEESDARKKLLETDLPKKPEEIHQSKKLEKTLSKLQFICKTMNSPDLKRHIATHFPELNKHPNEIAKALKHATVPPKLVLKSIGRFFNQTGSCQNKQIAARRVLVLILESFVVISSDGIKISKVDLDDAYKVAFDWRKRAVKDGGLRYMSEDDAKGLLLFISGFGILDRGFMVEDIKDLIRVCNYKEICYALRRSSVLMPRIPEVVDSMVKNNLEIEAADIVYAFGLEDKCHPATILTNFLHYKIKEFCNSPRFQANAAIRQHLSDLKSLRKCLEDHKVDPLKLFPDFNINEEIQYLEKVIHGLDSKSTGEKLTLKRKAKESEFSKTANHQQAKKICQHSPVDHYGMSQYDQSTYVDCNPVACGLAGGGYGGPVADPMVHAANHWPYGLNDHPALVDQSIGQPYLRQSQTYDSHPPLTSCHGGPLRRSPLESLPGLRDSCPPGGGFGRRDPSFNLYGFVDKVVENESHLRGCKGGGT